MSDANSKTNPSLILPQQERDVLTKLAGSQADEHRLVLRASIILAAASGSSNRQIARELNIHHKTVGRWRSRYLERREETPKAGVVRWLSDNKRTGRKSKFKPEFWVDVLKIATTDPNELGRPITHWTSQELADEIVTGKYAESIHRSTVSRFLKECQLKPHRVREWMNRKADPNFDIQAGKVKSLLKKAADVGRANKTKQYERDSLPKEITLSFDEKTGMQAKERIAPDYPMAPGYPQKREFEYVRHGTLGLLAFMDVESGFISGVTRETRTNSVTAEVLGDHVQTLLDQGATKVHIIMDQLNTHWSKDMVCRVAQLSGLPIPEDDQIEKGEQRRQWLSKTDKAVVFCYTPKHASWLNPIEIWFGVLARKVLRRGSFESKGELAERVTSFISYYNDKLAHPYRFSEWRRAA